MENNKKIGTVFGLVVIATLVATLVIVNNIDLISQKIDDQQIENELSHLIVRKNTKIRMLSIQLKDSMRSLTDVQNDLSSVNQKLQAMAKSAAETAAVASELPDSLPETPPAVPPAVESK